jgi:hypothetical protein
LQERSARFRGQSFTGSSLAGLPTIDEGRRKVAEDQISALNFSLQIKGALRQVGKLQETTHTGILEKALQVPLEDNPSLTKVHDRYARNQVRPLACELWKFEAIGADIGGFETRERAISPSLGEQSLIQIQANDFMAVKASGNGSRTTPKLYDRTLGKPLLVNNAPHPPP